MTIYPIADRFKTDKPNLVKATEFIVFDDKAEFDAYLLTLVTPEIPHVYTASLVGNDLIVYDNGVEVFKETIDSKHPFLDFDFENIGLAEQQAIQKHTGLKVTISNLALRKKKIDKVVTYLLTQANPTVFQTILNDTRNHRADYIAGSDVLIAWIQGVSSPVYGNFTLTGFPSKNYFSAARQTKLLSILS